MRTRRSMGRVLIVTALAALIALAHPAVGGAVPPPPPNPSDDEIEAGRENARSTAGRVGELANRVAAADAELLALVSEVELAMELANKAEVDRQQATDVATSAQWAADQARAASDAAGREIEATRERLDEFAAGSYRQGSTVGSMTAFFGSQSPQDVLARAQLLDAVSGSQLDVLDDMTRARTDKANKESVARAALAEARRAQSAAEDASRAADAAYDAAVTAQNDQQRRLEEVSAQKATLEQELAEAQAQVEGLEGQRDRYAEWLAAKEAEDAARAAEAAAAAEAQEPDAGRSASADSPVAGDAVSIVIKRALSQLGVPYAWGGGNGKGPTRGIRDGGAGDSHGDYRKVGFDCSGLMIYAFAGVGISLPHYSGYQAKRGKRVPLSQKRPGDMLFWASRGRIHHVALYLGNGQMVEAKQSGTDVMISPVRTSGIVNYAVRLL